MNLSRPFVRRPIATVLLTVGVALAGIAAFFVLPVAPLPQVDYPGRSRSARAARREPGDDGDQRRDAARAAARHDRRRQRDHVDELGTARRASRCSSTSNRNIDGAARDVQAAINASRVDLPATLRSNPTYRKVNPSAAPVMILALTSKTQTPGQIYDAVSNIVQQQLPQVEGVGDVRDRRRLAAGGARRAAAVRAEPATASAPRTCAPRSRRATPTGPRARSRATAGGCRSTRRRRRLHAQPTTRRWSSPGATARRCGCSDVADVIDGVEDTHTLGLFNGEPAIIVLITQPAGRQRHRDRRRACARCCRRCRRSCRPTSSCTSRPTARIRSAPRCTRSR